MGLGPGELLILLLIVLVLFGGTRLPKLARSLGQAQAEFRRGAADGAGASGSESGPERPEDAAPTS
jgi:sec-independent protein translocase protein TatA